MQAVNWNRLDDPYTKVFWDQNVRQFWVDEEIPLANDKLVWMSLAPEEQHTYVRVLGGLTLLDTLQACVGMPLILQGVPSYQAKAVLGFMGAMEHMHAKSYSSIFTTLCTSEQIDQIFEWVNTHPLLQRKVELIEKRYRSITDPVSLYEAMAASVLLESYLFYSGFYFPLLLAGSGKMINSCEIINLIIRDEAIHGVYVGMLAQEVFASLRESEQRRAHRTLYETLEQLAEIEELYTHELYEPIGRTKEVHLFTQYNADKALMNLGQPPYFGVSEEQVNPVVLAGLSTHTRHHDFFSTKGNSYVKALRVEPLRDEDFV